VGIDHGDAYRDWVEDSFTVTGALRDGKWRESVALGSEPFVMMTKKTRGTKAKVREAVGQDGLSILRESPAH